MAEGQAASCAFLSPRTVIPMLAGQGGRVSSSSRTNPKIHEVEPRENVARETLARYQVQHRAAAYACLQILEGKGIDRVYCDYQDDFVCRETIGNTKQYHFYQVKTKGKLNHQWDKREVLGISRRGAPKHDEVAKSFVGKLLMHTIRFNSSCGSVVFLTNVYLDDELTEIAGALVDGDLSPPGLQALIKCFNAALCAENPLDEADIADRVGKLRLSAGNPHLHPYAETFESLARDAIYKYSEIDLQHSESQEIIRNLVSLVHEKSLKKLMGEASESDLDDLVGIGIADLLDILSISRGAYEHLLAGGDPAALKSASIIQRKLSRAGASEQIIDYCSKWKIQWDIWLRDKRHLFSEFDINTLLDRLNTIYNDWTFGKHTFASLQSPIDNLWADIRSSDVGRSLSRDHLVGGVLAEMVRGEAQ